MMSALTRCFCLLLVGSGFLSQVRSADLMLPGSDGGEHAPLVLAAEKKAAVLIFASPFCNTFNTFLPEINAICEEHEGEFQFFVVHADPDLELTQIAEHKELLKVRPLALLDATQALARQLQAGTTPEVFVLDGAARVLYQGRVNDLYLGPTKRQRQATTRDLRDALEAIAKGEKVPNPVTEAMGCKIRIREVQAP
jgi:hypothetical protein